MILKNSSTIHTFNAIRIDFMAVVRLLRLILRINCDFILLRMYSSHADTIKSDDQHTEINHSSMIFRIPARHYIKKLSSRPQITSSWLYLHGTDTKLYCKRERTINDLSSHKYWNNVDSRVTQSHISIILDTYINT